MLPARLRDCLAAVVAVALAGCSNISLVDPPDPVIESGVAEYHNGSSHFLNLVKQDPGGSHARYQSREAQEFYASGSALLSTLIVRAQARGRACSAAQGTILRPLLAASMPEPESPVATPQEASDPGLSLEGGSCTGLALQALMVKHDRLRNIHRRNGTLNPFNAELAEQQIGDGVRVLYIVLNAAT